MGKRHFLDQEVSALSRPSILARVSGGVMLASTKLKLAAKNTARRSPKLQANRSFRDSENRQNNQPNKGKEKKNTPKS